MTTQLFEAEMNYQTAELILKELLNKGIIADTDFKKVHKSLVDAYISTIRSLSAV